MNVSFTGTDVVLLILGLMAFLLLAIQMRNYNARQRSEDGRLREEKLDKEGALLEQRERELDVSQTRLDARIRDFQEYLEDRYGDYSEDGHTGTVILAGEYFTFGFDLGPDLPAEVFETKLRDALQLPVHLAYYEDDTDQIEVRVHRVTFNNPLEIIVIISASVAVVSGVSLAVRRINRAVQDIRRSWSETRNINAGHDRDVSRAKLETGVYDTLLQALNEENGAAREKKVRRAAKIAQVAGDTSLTYIQHQTVTELEAAKNGDKAILSGSTPAVIQSIGPALPIESP